MTPCDTCMHFPVCNLREEYRQLLVTMDPFRKKNPAFQVTADCKYYSHDYKIALRKDGNSYFNGHDGV